MREVLARPWVGVSLCVPLALSSIYFSSITVFHDISKQTPKLARVGKNFSRWHLATAITSKNIFYKNIEAEICEILRMF